MKNVLLVFVSNLPALALISGGIYLATIDKAGWGWLIFLGALAIGSVEFVSSKKEKDD